MKLQYIWLDSVLDLRPLSHFEHGFFVSRIGCSEIVCDLVFSQE